MSTSDTPPLLPAGLRRRALLAGALAWTGCLGGTRTAEPERADDERGETGAAPTVQVENTTISVLIEGDRPSLSESEYLGWVRSSAQMIADYYGGLLPLPDLEVTLVTSGRGAVGYGHHKQGRWITVHCGRRTSTRSLNTDWVMVHEMLHATFPNLNDRHRWMQEGLSTYAEKLVRARAGDIDAQNLWSRLVSSMHHGRPKAGDRGLDKTHTWGRTYWGGALFWMVADVELRQHPGRDTSLDAVLRTLAQSGANARTQWTTQQVCDACDAASGTTVVSALYDRMAKAPGDVDLDALWTALGIWEREDGAVEFDDSAELAHVRRGISAARA